MSNNPPKSFTQAAIEVVNQLNMLHPDIMKRMAGRFAGVVAGGTLFAGIGFHYWQQHNLKPEFMAEVELKWKEFAKLQKEERELEMKRMELQMQRVETELKSQMSDMKSEVKSQMSDMKLSLLNFLEKCRNP